MNRESQTPFGGEGKDDFRENATLVYMAHYLELVHLGDSLGLACREDGRCGGCVLRRL